jgi:hypothetical protein
MEFKVGLSRIENLDVSSTRTEAERAGLATFVLPSNGIVDRASFFDAVRGTLPLDPPLLGSRSWDALSDSLWEGLRTHMAPRIAIVWPNTAAMAAGAGSDFEIALQVLADVANSLGDSGLTCGSSKEVVVLVD